MKAALFFPLTLSLLLAACASKVPAPVSDGRTTQVENPVLAAPVVAPVAAPVVSGPSYTVKKGDRLYAIALDHGLDYKDIAAWNGLEDPNLIRVDQVLRLSPPDAPVAGATGAVVRPIAPPANLEVKPVKPVEQPVASASGISTETLKREPKGGKVAYSPEALERLRRAEAGKTTESATATAATPVAPASAPTTPVQSEPAVVAAAPAVAPVAPPAVPGVIEWSWPIAGAVLAPFSDGTNKGIDLAGKLGEPIGAAAAGKVVYAGSGLRGYGKLVIVRHSADYLSAYAHAKEILVKEGQTVTRLQKIAEVGDTDADRPKLHFEVRYRGVPVDPQKHLPGR